LRAEDRRNEEKTTDAEEHQQITADPGAERGQSEIDGHPLASDE
jgi:hypothetical protein